MHAHICIVSTANKKTKQHKMVWGVGGNTFVGLCTDYENLKSGWGDLHRVILFTITREQLISLIIYFVNLSTKTMTETFT